MRLQGSYNFYYCRLGGIVRAHIAYKAHIISTIVDLSNPSNFNSAYKAHIISTIVDYGSNSPRPVCLQGSYNFYYCR